METGLQSVNFLGWDDFLDQFVWKQGEHITLLGPNGYGKTTLALAILNRREYVIVFGTKKKDSTLDGLIKEGYYKAKEWPPPAWAKRVVLWPDMRSADFRVEQQRVFYDALTGIYQAGGYCVYLDELRYVCDTLKLEGYVENLWQQGRSVGISVVGGNQRPRFVSLNAYDQATHLFLWSFSDKQNVKRIAEISGRDEKQIETIIRDLPKYDVLYVNTATGEMVVTNTKK